MTIIIIIVTMIPLIITIIMTIIIKNKEINSNIDKLKKNIKIN
jgi:hypothetical protein